MPKDQWRRANNKSRFGDKKRRASVAYTVRAGAPCFIRPAGGRDWTEYNTTKINTFAAFAWKSAQLYGFYKAGYEMKVMKRYVVVNANV